MGFPAVYPVVVVLACGAMAPYEQTWRFDVPRQPAAGGISTFSRQARTIQLLVAQDAILGRTTNRLRGTYSLENGLTILLRGSGLTWRRTGQTTYSLVLGDGGSAR